MLLTLGHVISDFIWRLFTSSSEGLASSALTLAAPELSQIDLSLTFTSDRTLEYKGSHDSIALEDSTLRQT